jgi:hypothetical protein
MGLGAGTGDQPPWRLAIPGFTGRERAMVLIGLIIIAVALLVPGVPGIRWKRPVRQPKVASLADRSHRPPKCPRQIRLAVQLANLGAAARA